MPYTELPDSEKEYDRGTALGVLAAILALGYRILNLDSDADIER